MINTEHHDDVFKISSQLSIIVKTTITIEDNMPPIKKKAIFFQFQYFSPIPIEFYELVVLKELFDPIKKAFTE